MILHVNDGFAAKCQIQRKSHSGKHACAHIHMRVHSRVRTLCEDMRALASRVRIRTVRAPIPTMKSYFVMKFLSPTQ